MGYQAQDLQIATAGNQEGIEPVPGFTMNELLSYLEENDKEDVPNREPGGITIDEYAREKDLSYYQARRKLEDFTSRGLLSTRIEFDRAVMRRARVWRKK